MAEPLKLFKLFHKHGIEYVVIDRVAAALHGIPVLATSIAVCPLDESDNNVKIAQALMEINGRLKTEDGISAEPIDLQTLEKTRRDLGIGHGVSFVTDIGNVDIVYVPAGMEQVS